MTGNCKDCRCWEKSNASAEYGTCRAVDNSESDAPVGESDMCIFDLHAELKTGPMFGCLKFNSQSKVVAEI